MKPLCFSLILFFCFSPGLQAQTDTLTLTRPDSTMEIFDVTRPPSFPGGESAMLNFLATTIQYPEQARSNNIQGTVAVTFVVDKEGKVSNGTIIRDIGAGCGEEVLRVLTLMPAWIPGEVDGMPVKVRFTLPVRFRLEGDKKKKKG